MAHRDIITIGASAGGVEALKVLAAGLPANLAAALIVVMHLPSGARRFLPEVLSQSGPLTATEPADGEPIRMGHIYVAPSDSHLLIAPDTLRLTRGPREGRQRPAINVTFRSAAMSYHERVIGVVLTGMLDDGTAGLRDGSGQLAMIVPDSSSRPNTRHGLTTSPRRGTWLWR